MTPKEKAEELVNKFMDYADAVPEDYDWMDPVSHCDEKQLTSSKQCALIAVDEMIEIYSKLFKDFDKVSLFVTAFKNSKDFNETMNDLKNNQLKPYAIKSVFYWEQVRKEIEQI
jgi:hypothetical protein